MSVTAVAEVVVLDIKETMTTTAEEAEVVHNLVVEPQRLLLARML
jgi:hypothetical protein